MARHTLSAIGTFFETFRSAVAVSGALESRRQPDARDLRTLGIDPAKFRGIGRY